MKRDISHDFILDAYTTDQLKIMWRQKSPIDMNPDLKLPDMNISRVEAQYCNGTYDNGNGSNHSVIRQHWFYKPIFR